MTRSQLLTTVAASLLLALSTTAHAGQAERARIAISEAHGKLEAADKVAISGESMAIQTRAHAALQSAEAALANDKKETALANAKHASELSDMAIIAAERDKRGMVRNAQVDAANANAAAMQSNAAAAQSTAMAAQSTAVAQQSAIDANARAATAEAAAMRPAPVTTVVQTTEKTVVPVTTHKTTTHTTHRKRTIHHRPTAVVAKTTVSTTVTPQ